MEVPRIRNTIAEAQRSTGKSLILTISSITPLQFGTMCSSKKATVPNGGWPSRDSLDSEGTACGAEALAR